MEAIIKEEESKAKERALKSAQEALYKENHIKIMKQFVTNGIDTNGNKIVEIYIKADEYVIYEIQTKTSSNSLKVYIHTKEEENEEPIIRYGQVRANFNKFKGLLYKVNDDVSYKGRVAHILSHAIATNQIKEANNQFEDLFTEINTEYLNQFKRRLYYLITILIITILLIGVSGCIYGFALLEGLVQLKNIIFMATAGSIGGFISVSRRLKKTVFEKGVAMNHYIIYGIERVFISMFGAAIIYFAIYGNVIFGFVKEMDNPTVGFILFSFVAGFSETLIPNLLIKLEAEKQT